MYYLLYGDLGVCCLLLGVLSFADGVVVDCRLLFVACLLVVHRCPCGFSLLCAVSCLVLLLSAGVIDFGCLLLGVVCCVLLLIVALFVVHCLLLVVVYWLLFGDVVACCFVVC